MIMPSWQFRIIKVIFRLRRFLNPPTGVLDVEKARAETEALAANFKTKLDLVCTPVDAHMVPAEWIATPETSAERVILYFHGGSYNSGSIKAFRPLVANIANAARARALIVDYRLAPEYPFPAAVEDANIAYRWLLDNGFSPDRIVIAGDSCGGGLALALLISLRDAGEVLPAAAVCLSPWTDLTFSGESWETNAKKDIMLDPGALRESAQVYLGESDPRTPLASPLYADLRDLPPILIQVGSDELILSDSTRLAERARAAGADVTLEVWEGMQHEWHFAADMLPEGRQAVERIGQFVQDHLGQTGLSKSV
jgi:monoterpene epsilon-lactone hydrolase